MRTIITTIISFLLILLFVYTGISKWIDFKTFVSDLKNQPFPDSWTRLLSILLPPVEILIAVLLFFERTTTAALIAAAILMSMFTIYTALVLLHVFRYVPCSCGGVIRKLSWPQHLVFNLFFLFISVAALMIRKYFMHDNRISRKPV